MGRRCTICSHAERGAIEELLVAQTPFRHIASRFGTSTGALQRHLKVCLTAEVPAALASREVNSRELVLAKIDALADEAKQAADSARAEGAAPPVIQSVAARGRLLDLEARVRGALSPERAELELRTEAPRLREVLADVAEFVGGCCTADRKRWDRVIKEAKKHES